MPDVQMEKPGDGYCYLRDVICKARGTQGARQDLCEGKDRKVDNAN